MFKLLSIESKIFSIPIYLVFLLFIVISFNIFNFNTLSVISAVITFSGIALGYFLFTKINLTYQVHLPLFLYTFLIFGLYPGYLDIGIAVSLLTNSFILLILTNQDDVSKNSNYLLIGSLLAVNFIFLPTTYPLIIFVLLHIIGTSGRIGLNIFRLFYGMFLIGIAYFSVAYFLHLNSWNLDYFPKINLEPMKDFGPLYLLSPIAILLVYAVMDHFMNFNKKSPTSRYKYSFVLVFTLSQLITIFLYMGKSYEYLLLIAFPVSIILSRMLLFLPKYWMKEIFLWLILLSLIVYKISNYVDFNL